MELGRPVAVGAEAAVADASTVTAAAGAGADAAGDAPGACASAAASAAVIATDAPSTQSAATPLPLPLLLPGASARAPPLNAGCEVASSAKAPAAVAGYPSAEVTDGTASAPVPRMRLRPRPRETPSPLLEAPRPGRDAAGAPCCARACSVWPWDTVSGSMLCFCIGCTAARSPLFPRGTAPSRTVVAACLKAAGLGALPTTTRSAAGSAAVTSAESVASSRPTRPTPRPRPAARPRPLADIFAP